MPLLDRKRAIVAKIETTYGTDAAPTGAANAILISDLDVTPIDAEMLDRDLLRTYLGASPQIMAARSVQMTFSVELAGSGTAGTAPKYGPLLRACGMSETITASTKVEYKPISTAFESATIWASYDGVLHKLIGGRGTFKLTADAKSIPKLAFEMRGLFVPVVDGAVAGIDYAGWTTPLAVNKANTTAFSLHGTSVPMSKFGIDIGNQVTYRNIVNSELVMITDRQSMGNVSMEAGLMATKNWFSIAEAATLGALSMVHGTVAGNIVEVTSSNVQIVTPKYSSEDGIMMIDADLRLVPSSTGNDEITLIIR